MAHQSLCAEYLNLLGEPCNVEHSRFNNPYKLQVTCRVSLPVMQTLCNPCEYSRRLENILPCHHVYATVPVRHFKF